MLKLLRKSIGFPFYQQHAGLFLVIFYLLFGAVEGSQLISYHHALLVAICSSPVVFSVVFVFWILYSAKCYQFVKQKLEMPNFNFSTGLFKNSRTSQLKVWCNVYAFMLLPIIVYAIFMLYVALKNSYYFSFFATLSGLVSLLATLSFLTFKQSNYNFKPSRNWVFLRRFTLRKPFWTWPLFHLVYDQPIAFLICKLVSFLSFKAILWVFADVGPDSRVYLTALLGALLSHSVLFFNWVKFDASYLAFSKSLKLSTTSRLISWLGVGAVLLVPELLLFVGLTKFTPFALFSAVLFSIAVWFSLLTLVYVLGADMDRYIRYLLFFFFIAMLTILGNCYLEFSIGLLSISILTFMRIYPRIDFKDLV